MEQKAKRSRMRTIRFVLWGLVALTIVATGGVYISKSQRSATDDVMTAQEAMRASIQADFELVNHLGETVTEETFRGRFMLVFFGFTNCPDICPTTLNDISVVLANLGQDADRIAPLFVTVDPERDTPAQMAEYVAAFDERIIGLSGTSEQIKAAASAFKIYYAKAVQDGAPDGYTMDHSAYTYLFNTDGEFEAFFLDHDEPERITDRIREILKS